MAMYVNLLVACLCVVFQNGHTKAVSDNNKPTQKGNCKKATAKRRLRHENPIKKHVARNIYIYIYIYIAFAAGFAIHARSAAQTTGNLIISGAVTAGVEYVNNIAGNADGIGRKYRSLHMNNVSSSWPSHWDLRGTEDLGNGLSAVFLLASNFPSATGALNSGRIFSRAAWAGLKSRDWGQIALGRQYNMLIYGIFRADFLGPNAYGMANLDVYLPTGRMDNSVTYLYGELFGTGPRFGLAWARGRDTVSVGPPGGSPGATNCGMDYREPQACHAYSAMFAWDGAAWGAAAAWDTITGRDDAPNFWGLGKNQHDTRWTLNGYANITPTVKLGLIYLNRKSDAGIRSDRFDNMGARSDLWTLSAAWRISPQVLLDGAVNYIRYRNTRNPGGERIGSAALYYVLRSQYYLSRRTSLVAHGGWMDNRGMAAQSATGGTVPPPSPKRGGAQAAFGLGMRHNF